MGWRPVLFVGLALCACCGGGLPQGYGRHGNRGGERCEYMGPMSTLSKCTRCWSDHCGADVATCYGPQWADATPGPCASWQQCRDQCENCRQPSACLKQCDDAAPACATCQHTLATCYWECANPCYAN